MLWAVARLVVAPNTFFSPLPQNHRAPPQDEEKDARNPRLVRAEEEEVRGLMAAEGAGGVSDGGGAAAAAGKAPERVLSWAFD